MPGSFLNTSHQTVGWFADLNQQGRLVVRPPFQRRPVWAGEEKAFLVDTILRGYPVPEIYVYATPSTDGSTSDVISVVDGQQRLRTCLEFLVDQFPVVFDTHKLEPLYTLADTPWFNKRFSELNEDQKNTFRRYKLIVRDLEGVSDEEIRHMFHRLNQSNVSLNAQELRYSMYQGGLLEVVEQLVKREEWDEFRIFTQMQRRRMLDSEYVTELVIGYLHWPQNKKDNIDHYYRQYSGGFPFKDEIIQRFAEVLEYLSKVFPIPRMSGTRWYRKSDFYTLFLALARGKIGMDVANIERLRAQLTDFSILIGTAATPGESDSVQVYREAVERAATDRARRVRREDALVAFLSGAERIVIDVNMAQPDEAGALDEADDLNAEDDEEYADRPEA
jgi:Protein of unknown function DUF262